MQSQPALDRRQHPRRNVSLVVTYRPEDLTARYDITQTQNVSRGGMLLTTAKAFEPGVLLAIQAKLTFRGLPRLVMGTAEAVESKEIVQDLLYETRLRFVELDRWSCQIIGYFCAGRADQLAAPGRAAMEG